MKAIAFRGVHDVRVESIADPGIVEPTDAVVRITTSAVCGSDLHQYHGRVPGIEPGAIMGHEFMGVVEEVGREVRAVSKGDRVVAPFSISCGRCEWCRRGLPTQCSTTGRAVFGGRFGKQYPGAQAERIRVPFAEVGKLQPTRIITHTLPLADAPRGYKIFDEKEDRAIKVLLKP